ncbi:MAG: hypothetical protein ACFB21_08120 [Opitutales bacterium]
MIDFPNIEAILSTWYRYPLVLLIAFAITYVLVPLVIRLAPVIGMIDIPDARRVHKAPTPRGGGLAVWIGFHLSLAILFIAGEGPNHQLDAHWWMAFLTASTVLLFVGVLDDIRGVKPIVKLGGQAAAALILIHLGGSPLQNILGFALPAWLDFFLTLFWYLALINAFNLIDGLDGLCSGVAIIGAFGLGASFIIIRGSSDFLVPLALIGACLAFLRYNFHPAKIFLGDTGSMFLGFALAAFALETSSKSTFAVSIGIALLATGIPILDTLLAIWRRSMRKILAGKGVEVMGADKDHLHHRLLASGFTTRGTALLIYAGSATLVLFGLLSILFAKQSLGIYLIGFVLAAYVIVRHIAHIELWDTGVAVSRGLQRPRPQHISLIVFTMWDVLAIVLAHGAAIQLLPDPLWEPVVGSREEFFRTLPFWTVPMFASLVFTQTYARVWSKAGAVDFMILQLSIIAGTILSLSTVILTGGTGPFLVPRAMLFGGGSFFLILASRSIPQAFRMILHFIAHRREVTTHPARRLLFYGVSERSLLLMREIEAGHSNRKESLLVVGYIDDDSNLRRRMVKGHRVFGSVDDLPQLVGSLKIDEIVVCCELDPVNTQKLVTYLSDHDVALTVYRATRKPLLASSKERETVS